MPLPFKPVDRTKPFAADHLVKVNPGRAPGIGACP